MDGGASMTAVDKIGRTVRDLAVKNSCKYTVEVLDSEKLTSFRFSQKEFIKL